MSDNDQAHLDNMRRLYERRLRLLETQSAQFGIYVPPHIQMEIEDTRAEIARIKTQLGQTETHDSAPPHTAAHTTLTESDLQQLVGLLLATPAIADREAREAVIRGLPSQIANSIVRSSQPRVDVANIVRTTLNYEGGLRALLSQVRMFEDDSYPMRALDTFMQSVAFAEA